jgi:hypothetical protein
LFNRYIPVKQAGLLSLPSQLLGFTPGIWPVSGKIPGIIGSTLAAGAAGRYLIPPVLRAMTPNKTFGDEDRQRSFARRLGLLAALGTGATLTGLTWPPVKQADASSLFGNDTIPISGTLSDILNDSKLDMVQKAKLVSVVTNASGGKFKGLISPGDILRGAVQAGLGYATGKILGTVFALPEQTTNRLGQAGALGSLLMGAGVIG